MRLTKAQLNRRLRVTPEGGKPRITTARKFLKETAHLEDLTSEVADLIKGERDSFIMQGKRKGEVTWVALAAAPKPGKRERQYKHVLAGELAAGKSEKAATRIAAATVNKFRAARAASGQGPALVTEGGSRRQWYPGKAAAKKRRGGK